MRDTEQVQLDSKCIFVYVASEGLQYLFWQQKSIFSLPTTQWIQDIGNARHSNTKSVMDKVAAEAKVICDNSRQP